MQTSNFKRATAGLLLAALVVATVAPAAEAGGKHRYKGHKKHRRHHVQRVVYQPRTVIHHHSDAAPALAFIGGVVLGAVISNSNAQASYHAEYVEPVYTGPQYYFYDTYCSQRFVSLDVYHHHLSRHHHPHVMRVFTVGNGHWIDTVHYSGGGWAHYEGGW